MMRKAKPGITEYQLKAEFDYTLLTRGVLTPAFPPIVSAGVNNFCIHYHSYTGTAQDGDMVLNDVIALYANGGFDVIAITDHDTVAGLPRASDYAKKLKFPLITGIELSAEYQGYDVHVLGYWIDVGKIAADRRLQQMIQAREERCRRMARRLTALGMPVDVDKIITVAADTKRSLGRPHVAQVMVEAGYVENLREAFSKWLGHGMPAYVPRLKLSPHEALEMVATAGGIGVLAHPVGVPDHLVPRLVRQGLGGIEVYHSDHNRMAENKYLQMAHHYHLAAMGGSDFHVPGQHDIGCRTTSQGQLQFLSEQRERLQARRRIKSG
jgi:predicted metal-dependent phosphoesterase TrpH